MCMGNAVATARIKYFYRTILRRTEYKFIAMHINAGHMDGYNLHPFSHVVSSKRTGMQMVRETKIKGRRTDVVTITDIKPTST